MNKKIIISILGVSVIGLANAGEKTGEIKSSATMHATCSISANPIGFGAVSSPLLAQSSQSEMIVRCSNASAYTIDLAYGGIYGQANIDSGYTINFSLGHNYYNSYNIYDSFGIAQGSLTCGFSGPLVGQVYFNNSLSANLYGYTNTDNWQQDTKGACTSNNTEAGTYPRGWTGAYNASSNQPLSGPSYAYGVMNGISKGDNLAYSITVPGDVNKVWNSGNNNYKSTGNGDNQTIPLNAKIVVDKSSSKYLAPDIYIDTVTAVISY